MLASSDMNMEWIMDMKQQITIVVSTEHIARIATFANLYNLDNSASSLPIKIEMSWQKFKLKP